MANSKRVAALGIKILNILKDMGMSPRFGMMTKVSRNPEFRNLYNADLTSPEILRKGLGNIEDPEQLKKLVRMDSDFLPQIKNEEELETFLNNLQFLRSTYPNIFSKAEVVTESKTGLKTLVDDVNEKLQGKKSMETFDPKTGEVIIPKAPVSITEVIDEGIKKQADMARKGLDPANPDNYIKENKSRQLTREEIQDYEEAIGRNSEEWLSEGTVDEAEKALKRSKAEEAYYYGQYKAGKLNPEPGENSQSRMRFLRSKAEEAEATGDRRLITPDEMDELSNLESIYLKDVDEAYGIDTAIKKQLKDFTSEKDLIKQKYGNVIDDNLLQQILIDDNPQRKAEVLATIDEALKMQEKGIPYEEIINIIKNTTRTKQAKGGLIKGVSYKSMFNDLDKTLNKGLGTMFRKKR